MTRQEIYNKVRDHLLKQNARCAVGGGGSCAYRWRGKACAVGGLLTDEEAARIKRKRMNVGANIAALQEAGLLPKRLLGHEALLVSLQDLHDTAHVSLWSERLKYLALRYGLKP